MESITDLYGLYVACGEGQHDEYMMLKHELETKLESAVSLIKKYGHKGIDTGFVMFNNYQSFLSCCIENKLLWLGLYLKESKTIQRYVVFDDISGLTHRQIENFAFVIENILANPDRLKDIGPIVEAWETELEKLKVEFPDRYKN